MGSITHAFTDAHVDGADATLVRPSNWNDAHNFSLSAADVGAPSGSGNSTGANTGDQTITLTGDVTGSGTGSFATTLATIPIAKGGTASTTAQAAAAALGVSFLLDQSAVQAADTNDTNENILGTVTVPANAMGANGSVRIRAAWTSTNSANSKTFRARFGGASGTIVASRANTTQITYWVDITIQNKNNAGSQISSAMGLNGSSSAVQNINVSGAIDTTQAQTIVFTGQKDAGAVGASESLILLSYVVELLYKA